MAFILFRILLGAGAFSNLLLADDFPVIFLENGKYGYRLRSGEVISPARFEYAQVFDPVEKVAWVRLGDKLGLIKTDGTWAAEPSFDGAECFSEGSAPARRGAFTGYVDPRGRWIIEPRFEGAKPFRDGKALVSCGSLTGWINTKGKIAGGPLFLELRRMKSPDFKGCGCASSVVGLLDLLSENDEAFVVPILPKKNL